MVLLEQFDSLANHIAATACSCRRATGLDAFHPVESLKDKVLGAQFFGMEIHILKNIDHSRHEAACERKRTVMLGVTADLQHTLAMHGKGRGQVGRGGRLADPAFAVDRKDLCAFNLGVLRLMDLNRALAILATQVRDFISGAHESLLSISFFCSKIPRG